MKTLKIGFVGYSYSQFSVDQAKKILDKIFKEDILKYIDKYDAIEIVTGATNLGIPGLVYQYAEPYAYKTVGIMCKEGYTCELYPCDQIYAIGERWGDESKFFINYIDILYKIGGGPQSEREADMARMKYKPVYEFQL